MATQTTAGHGQSASSPAARWSELPDELLRIVHSKIPSLRARLRFAAVCRPWSDAAPPPTLPLLLLSPSPFIHNLTKRVYCPEDGEVFTLRFPAKPVGKWFAGCHDGGWMAWYWSSLASCSRIVIANPFSGAEVALSDKQRTIACDVCRTGPCFITKLVFSEAPTSADCVVAAITDTCSLALCRVGCADSGWATEGCLWPEKLRDVAFCGGELYGLSLFSETVYKFDVGADGDGAPAVTAAREVSVRRRDGPRCRSPACDPCYAAYIVDLRGELIMAVRIKWSPDREPSFKVFQLVQNNFRDAMSSGYFYRWAEVTSLGDYSLFLDETCSRAVHVPAEGRGLVQRNRIYYANHICLSKKAVAHGMTHLTTTDKGDDVYCRVDESASEERITSVGYYVRGGPHTPLWVLPPDV